MNRQLLDARIRAHQLIARCDEILAKNEEKKAHLRWLENLVRSGRPLPGTPGWDAETTAIYERMDSAHPQPAQGSGGMQWDGIWRTPGGRRSPR